MLIVRILCLVALLANCLVSFFVEDDKTAKKSY